MNNNDLWNEDNYKATLSIIDHCGYYEQKYLESENTFKNIYGCPLTCGVGIYSKGLDISDGTVEGTIVGGRMVILDQREFTKLWQCLSQNKCEETGEKMI